MRETIRRKFIEYLGGEEECEKLETMAEAFGESWEVINHNREMAIATGYVMLRKRFLIWLTVFKNRFII